MSQYIIRVRGLSSYMAEDANGEIQINTGSASDTPTLISDPLVDVARWLSVPVMGLNPENKTESEQYTTLGGRVAQRNLVRRSFAAQTERYYFPADFAAFQDLDDALSSDFVAVYVDTYGVTLHTAGYVMLCRATRQVSHEYDDGSKRYQITLEKVRPL